MGESWLAAAFAALVIVGVPMLIVHGLVNRMVKPKPKD